MKLSSSQLDNGLTIITDYVPDSKGVALQWQVNKGAIHEKFLGSAHFLEHLIACSIVAQGYTKEAYRRLEEISISQNFFTGPDGIGSYAHTSVAHASEILQIWGRLISEPLWTQTIFEREKKRIKGERDELHSNSYGLSLAESFAVVYRREQLGQTILGTEDSILAMRNRDVLTYMQENFHAKNMALFFSGAIEHAQAIELAEQNFSGLSQNEPSPIIDQFSYPAGKRWIIPKSEGVQETFVIFAGITSKHPCRQGLYDMRCLFQKELNDLLNDKAYSYSSPAVKTPVFKDFGQISISLTSLPEDISPIIQDTLHLAGQPEKWLHEKIFNQARLLREISNDFEILDPRERINAITNEFSTTGKILSPEEIIARDAETSFSDVYKAYHEWDRKNFSILSVGPATSDQIPTPENILASMAYKETAQPSSPQPA